MTEPKLPPTRIEEQEPLYLGFRRRLAAAAALWSAVTVLAALGFGAVGLALGIAGWGALALLTALWTFHRLQIEQFQHYRQVEALFSLYALIEISQPLPPMRLWAASPDFLLLAVGLIRRERARVVLELGSGVSTLVNAYALRANGGRIISLEHDAVFRQATLDYLAEHGLADMAEVIEAPLRSVRVNGTDWLWYDTAFLNALPPVDLLIVDGPPASVQSSARYPALPLLFDHLREGALILVDDCGRPQDAAVVRQWVKEFDLAVARVAATEKGAAVLRKTAGNSQGFCEVAKATLAKPGQS
ncbi:MAG: O-methyltransferase [Aggregatilineales bacterium]